VKYINRITPAEVHLLRKAGSTSLKDLLKLTFIDLLLKQILSTNLEIYIHPVSKEGNTYSYVSRGEKYKNVTKDHEMVLSVFFARYPELQVLMANFVKMTFVRSKGLAHYQFLVRKSKDLEGCFKKTLINRLFGTLSLTKKGKDYLKAIDDEIKQIDETLKNTDPEKRQHILAQINGNVCFMSHMYFTELTTIDIDLFSTHKENLNFDYTSTGGGCGGGSWESFGGNVDWSSSDSSGCSSGDGGCGSGCGGGCGGCS
jgi:hypothetical protein